MGSVTVDGSPPIEMGGASADLGSLVLERDSALLLTVKGYEKLAWDDQLNYLRRFELPCPTWGDFCRQLGKKLTQTKETGGMTLAQLEADFYADHIHDQYASVLNHVRCSASDIQKISTRVISRDKITKPSSFVSVHSYDEIDELGLNRQFVATQPFYFSGGKIQIADHRVIEYRYAVISLMEKRGEQKLCIQYEKHPFQDIVFASNDALKSGLKIRVASPEEVKGISFSRLDR